MEHPPRRGRQNPADREQQPARLNAQVGEESPLPMGTAPGAEAILRAKRRRRIIFWVVWLLLLVPIVYFAVQVIIILMPRMRLEVALEDTMTEAVTAKGYVVFNSQPVQGSGVLYYTTQPGEKVSAGGEVALVFATSAAADAQTRLDEVSEEIELLQEAQRTSVVGGDIEIYTSLLQSSLYELMEAMAAEDYSRLAQARADVTLAANRLQIATGAAGDFGERLAALEAQKQLLETQAVPTGSITVPGSGYFVPARPGYVKAPAGDMLVEDTPRQLQQRLQASPSYYGGDVAGHFISGYRWSFVTVVPAEEAEQFLQAQSDGKKLAIAFPEADMAAQDVKMTVGAVTVDEEAGIAKVVLTSERLGPEILQLNPLETAEIIFRTETGLRVDKNAVRLVDGVRGVYIKFGNNAYFRKIDVLLEDEFYVLVSLKPWEDGSRNLEEFDEVIVDSGGVELQDEKII